MNTNTITKSVLAAIALVGLGLVVLANIHTDILPLFGMVVSYGAAVVILALAATDTTRSKRLN
jgi:FtsH-binding integral membrane protein